MLSKFLIAVLVLIVTFVVLVSIGINHAGLLALACSIIAFLLTPRDSARF
jgi:hypothetical protein